MRLSELQAHKISLIDSQLQKYSSHARNIDAFVGGCDVTGKLIEAVVAASDVLGAVTVVVAAVDQPPRVLLLSSVFQHHAE